MRDFSVPLQPFCLMFAPARSPRQAASLSYLRHSLRSLLFAALAALLLLSVALFNGYPTVYPDTGSYLYTGAFRVALPPFRSPVYSAFLMATSLGVSAWFIVVAQALIVVAALYGTGRFLIDGDAKFRDACLLATATVLAALTSLPWLASLLLPDVFAGVVFLSLFLLAFDAQMKFVERLGLAAILTLGVAAHSSLLPIAATFVAGLAGVNLVGAMRGGSPFGRWWLAWLAVPIAVAALWTANLNREMGAGFKVSPSGNEFLLGRMFSDGLAARFLRENCPAKPFVACKYLNNLPRKSEEFLFWHPLLHEMQANGDEMTQIVRGTILSHPFRFAGRSAAHSLRQFVTLRTGDEVRDWALHAQNSNAEVIQQVFPRDSHALADSRLEQGRLIWPAKVAAVADTAAFWLSLLGCIFLARKRRDDKWNWFFYSALVYLGINAAVCATFAGVYDRYQSRVAWLIPLCLCVGICRVMQSRKSVDRERSLEIEVEV